MDLGNDRLFIESTTSTYIEFGRDRYVYGLEFMK
jgi:hypothetical protein